MSVTDHHPLAHIFTQPLEKNATEQSLSFQFRLCKFLNAKDLKSLRTVNTFCHRFVSLSRAFGSKVNCKIHEKWHREYSGMGMTYGSCWLNFTFDQFAYHRHHSLFKHYWVASSKNIVNLTLMKCSMECDGLAFILNECHQLENLVIDDVKLKHLKNKDTLAPHLTVPVRTSPKELHPSPITTAMRRSLKTLTLQSLRNVSRCTMGYLRDRSGSLETLVVNRVFKDHSLPGITPLQAQEERQQSIELSESLALLITANAGSLQSLKVTNNQYQDVLIQVVSQSLGNNTLRDFEVTIGTAEEKLAVQEFLGLPSVRPERLAIQILGRFTAADVADVFSSQYEITKHLSITFDGYKVSGEGEPGVHELDIQQPIHQFQSLESLTLKDSKLWPLSGLLTARGLRSERKGPIPTAENVEFAKNRIKSGLHERFLYNSPFPLQELSLVELMFLNEDVSNLASLRNMTGYRNLTKLEIIGPVMYPIKNFRIIPKEMRKLKSLILRECGLTDELMTGLSRPTANHLRKSGWQLANTLSTGSGDDFDVLMRSVDRTVRRLVHSSGVYLEVGDEFGLIWRQTRAPRNEYVLPKSLQPVADGDGDGLMANEDDERYDNFEELDDIADAEGIVPIAVRGITQVPEVQLEEVNPEAQGEPLIMEQDVNPVDVLNDGLEDVGEDEIDEEMIDEPEMDRSGDSRSHIYMLKDLEHLDLSGNCEISNVTVYDSINNPKLKTLVLEHCKRLTDFTLEWIAKNHPNLEVLRVRGCRRLSQFGFNQLIQKCPKLQRIYTTRKIALDEFEFFNIRLSPCYADIVKYSEATTVRAKDPLVLRGDPQPQPVRDPGRVAVAI